MLMLKSTHNRIVSQLNGELALVKELFHRALEREATCMQTVSSLKVEIRNLQTKLERKEVSHEQTEKP